MNNSSRSPTVVIAVQALFFLNAAIWLAFGIGSLVRLAHRNPDQPITAAVVAILMFGNVGAMLGAGLGLGRRRRWLYTLALLVLAVNIILTVTDRFGIFDLITLIIDVALLGLLIATRKLYSAPQVR
jgi:hypothetical protein